MTAGSITGSVVGSAAATMATRVAVGRGVGVLAASFVGALGRRSKRSAGRGRLWLGGRDRLALRLVARRRLRDRAFRLSRLIAAITTGRIQRDDERAGQRHHERQTGGYGHAGEDSACRLRRSQPQPGVCPNRGHDGARDGRARRQLRQHLQTTRQVVGLADEIATGITCRQMALQLAVLRWCQRRVHASGNELWARSWEIIL